MGKRLNRAFLTGVLGAALMSNVYSVEKRASPLEIMPLTDKLSITNLLSERIDDLYIEESAVPFSTEDFQSFFSRDKGTTNRFRTLDDYMDIYNGNLCSIFTCREPISNSNTNKFQSDYAFQNGLLLTRSGFLITSLSAFPPQQCGFAALLHSRDGFKASGLDGVAYSAKENLILFKLSEDNMIERLAPLYFSQEPLEDGKKITGLNLLYVRQKAGKKEDEVVSPKVSFFKIRDGLRFQISIDNLSPMEYGWDGKVKLKENTYYEGRIHNKISGKLNSLWPYDPVMNQGTNQIPGAAYFDQNGMFYGIASFRPTKDEVVITSSYRMLRFLEAYQREVSQKANKKRLTN